MADRRELTPEFVDAALAPESGEHWIADTLTKGFGLRLWAGPNGGGRAYCLRAKNANGRFTRRQFQPWIHARPCLSGDEQFAPYNNSLGIWLPYARHWAENERYCLRGEQTPSEQEHSERLEKRRIAEQKPLREHIHWYLSDGTGAAMGEAYRDQITTLIHDWLPATLLATKLGSVTPEDLTQALVKPDRPFHSMNLIRNFISKLIRSDEIAHGGHQLDAASYSRIYWDKISENWGPQFRERLARYELYREPLETIITAEKSASIPAAFLHVYLNTGAKQKPLLSARWDMIVEDHWYPYRPESRSSWFLARERLSDELLTFLSKHRSVVESKFGDAPYLFPSKQRDGSTIPITSVQRYWRNAITRVGWDARHDGPAALKDFAEVCKRRSRPSMFMDPNGTLFQILVRANRDEMKEVGRALSIVDTN